MSMQASTNDFQKTQEDLKQEVESARKVLANLESQANPKPSISITFEPNDTRFIINMTVSKEAQEPMISESQLLIAGMEMVTMAEKMRNTRIDAGMKMEVRPQ
jgi:hypothetical protein